MRTSKVVGFSIPPELHKKFERLLKTKHKTKSEFFREMFDVYTASSATISPTDRLDVRESDLAGVLSTYWKLRSSSECQTIIVGSGIIVKNKQVLLAARKDTDEIVEHLSWTFPGGKMETLNFESELKQRIKEKTNLDVSVGSLITARVHPDAGFKNTQVVVLYFHCTPVGKQKEKAGTEVAELQWVKPSKVYTYFTTSVTDDVTKFLMAVEK